MVDTSVGMKRLDDICGDLGKHCSTAGNVGYDDSDGFGLFPGGLAE